jgi:formylmethanofuran dehydrogenase subunit A
MITKLKNVRLVDGISTSARPTTLWIVDEVISRKPDVAGRVDAEYDLAGHIVMAGGIDLHTHIGGGKVNLARMLLAKPRSGGAIENPLLGPLSTVAPLSTVGPLSSPVPGTWETGRRYLQMGYTTCIEPAMLPANARQSHAEMQDTPGLDTGGYVVLGNDRLLLRMIAQGASQEQINAYVGWMVASSSALAIKVVNAGGIDAFKFNQRRLDVDEYHPQWPITPRDILRTLSRAAEELGLAHPLHVHCSNLGVAGNIESTLATLDAVEGRRIHLTHAQFHCYGDQGPYGFSSAAERLAERVNRSSQITLDVGQVLFGQTITLSADTMHQFGNRKLASPRQGVFQDLECQAGCGALPFRYRESQYVHGLQWTIGLELFLRVQDASRIFLTTDHPNGGPFTGYPHLIRLLMDYDYRMSIFERLHPEVRRVSRLGELKREYRLDEVAAMTRLGPARALGLHGRGHLMEGAVADLVVYRESGNVEEMFGEPRMVFKRGRLVVRDSEVLGWIPKRVLVAEFSGRETLLGWGRERGNRQEWEQQYGYSPGLTVVHWDELRQEGIEVERAGWQD